MAARLDNLGSTLRPFTRLAILGAAAVIALVIFWRTLPPRAFETLTHAGSMGLMGYTIVRMLRRFRRERPFTKLAQYIAMGAPVLTFCFYLFVNSGKSALYIAALLPAAFVGFLYGRGWQDQTRLWWKNGRVYGQNRGWWIAYWGGALMLTQTMAYLRSQHGFNLALLVTAFTTARTVTVSGGMLQGILKIENDPDREEAYPPPEDPPAATSPELRTSHVSAFCEECGGRLEASDAFCESCGTPVTAEGGAV